MAKITSLFSSKKAKNNTDGQEEFFKEDFPPVVNRPATQKEEKVEPKKVSAPKKPAKKKTESKNRVAPQQVERIINPKSTKAKSTAKKAEKPAAKVVKAEEAKKPATKKAEPKKAEKPISKKVEPKKATAKKPDTKKTEAKPKKAASKEIYDDSPEIKGAVAVQQSREIASGKWEINRAKDGRFFFSLYASNHVIIAYSQIYSSLTAVTTGINSVISNASKAETEDTTLKKSASIPCPKWEIYLDKAEQYRFRLYAPNGLVVCHSSHGYSTKGGCKGGIESIKRFASEEASVNKTYLK